MSKNVTDNVLTEKYEKVFLQCMFRYIGKTDVNYLSIYGSFCSNLYCNILCEFSLQLQLN